MWIGRARQLRGQAMTDKPSIYVPGRTYTIADRSGVDDLGGTLVLASAEFMLRLNLDEKTLVLLFSDQDLADQYLEGLGDEQYAVAVFAGENSLRVALVSLRDGGVDTVVFDAPPKGKNYNATGFPIQSIIDQLGGTAGQVG